MMMHVMLSVPSPSLFCRLVGQLVSIIISTTVANPLNLLLSIDYSNFASLLIVFDFFRGELLFAFRPGDFVFALP